MIVSSCYLLNWLICTKLCLSCSPKFELMRAAVLTRLCYFKVMGYKRYICLLQVLSSYLDCRLFGCAQPVLSGTSVKS